MVIISGLSRMPQTKQTLNIEYGLVAECVNKCYRMTQNLFSDEISREEWMQRSFLYLKHVKNFSNCARLHKANTWLTCNAYFVPWRENRRVAAAATAAITSVMFDSVRPHRWQPIELPHPWDSQDKNTGVGCRFLLQWLKVKSESEVAQSYPTLSNPMDHSLPGSSVHEIFQARVLEWGVIGFSNRRVGLT